MYQDPASVSPALAARRQYIKSRNLGHSDAGIMQCAEPAIHTTSLALEI